MYRIPASCACLEIENHHRALERLDADDVVPVMDKHEEWRLGLANVRVVQALHGRTAARRLYRDLGLPPVSGMPVVVQKRLDGPEQIVLDTIDRFDTGDGLTRQEIAMQTSNKITARERRQALMQLEEDGDIRRVNARWTGKKLHDRFFRVPVAKVEESA